MNRSIALLLLTLPAAALADPTATSSTAVTATTAPARTATTAPGVAPVEPAAPVESAAPVEPPALSPEALSALTDPGLADGATTAESAQGVLVVGGRADRSRIAGSAHYIGSEELERFEQDDIHRVLSPVPGVYVREEEGYGLRPNIGLRGASSERSAKVTLMEDGVLFAPAPYSAPAAYYFPITTRMSGVEVFKGPSAIRHGPNTIGGAINLLSRPIPKNEGGLDASAGLTRFGKLHGYYGRRWTHFGFLLEAVHLESAGFKELDGGGDTGFDKNELLAKARLQTDPGAETVHRLDLKASYADETSNETYLGLSDDDFARTPYRRYAASQRDRMEWWRTSAELRYLFRHGNFNLNAALYRQDLSRDWAKLNRFRGGPALDQILAAPSAGLGAVYYRVLTGAEDSASDDETLMVGTNGRDFVSQGAALTGHFKLEHELVTQDFELGVRVHYDAIEREHTEDGFAMRSGTLVSDGRPTETILTNRASTLAVATHLLDEVQLGRFVFTPGLRFEHIDMSFEDRGSGQIVASVDDVFVPGVGVHYQILDELGVLAGVHRGFSPASPGQAAEVDPEVSVNYEAGARLELEKTRVEVVGFFNDYSNLTGECTFSTGCREDQIGAQFNGGAVWAYGLEAAAGHELALPLDFRLRGDLSYTLTRSEFRTSFASDNPQFGQVEVGDELAYVPEHQLSLMFDLARGPFDLGAKLAYTSRMRNTAGQGEIPELEAIPDRVVLDASASYAIGDGKIYLRADNLTNTAYVASRRPFGLRPGHPLLVMIGYKHTFR